MLTAEEIRAALDEDADSVGAVLKEVGFLPESSVQTLVDEKTTGLKNKNRELLGKVKDLKDKVSDTSTTEGLSRLVDILHDNNIGVDDPDELDYDVIEAAVEELRSGTGNAGDRGNSKDIDKLERELTRAKRERDRAFKERDRLKDENASINTAFENERTANTQKDIDRRFKDALTAEGYPANWVKLLVPQLRGDSKATLETDEVTGESRIVTDDGKAVKEWVKDWTGTDEGKSYKPAPGNSGGGASGSGSGGGKPKSWTNMSIKERSTLMSDNPELARRLKSQARQA